MLCPPLSALSLGADLRSCKKWPILGVHKKRGPSPVYPFKQASASHGGRAGFFPGHPMSHERVAVLLDAGFVKRRLAEKIKDFPPIGEVTSLIAALLEHPDLSGSRLFRVYWYDADPFGQKRKNPIDGKRTNFATTPEAERNRKLMNQLETVPDVAVVYVR